MFAFGYALQRGLLNLIIRAPMFNTLLITFGLEVVLTYLAQLVFSRRLSHHQSALCRQQSSRWVRWSCPLVRLAAFSVAARPDGQHVAVSAARPASGARFAPRRRTWWRRASWCRSARTFTR